MTFLNNEKYLIHAFWYPHNEQTPKASQKGHETKNQLTGRLEKDKFQIFDLFHVNLIVPLKYHLIVYRRIFFYVKKTLF